MKKVGVLMGSDSDLPVVRKALDTLRAFGVEIPIKTANSLIVGRCSAWMASMQKVSTVVRLASRP